MHNPDFIAMSNETVDVAISSDGLLKAIEFYNLFSRKKTLKTIKKRNFELNNSSGNLKLNCDWQLLEKLSNFIPNLIA